MGLEKDIHGKRESSPEQRTDNDQKNNRRPGNLGKQAGGEVNKRQQESVVPIDGCKMPEQSAKDGGSFTDEAGEKSLKIGTDI